MRYVEDLEEYGDSDLIAEVESRGYKVVGLSDETDEKLAFLYQRHLAGQDISKELFDDFLSKLNRIV